MKKWKEPAKRGLSLFLALIMCLGLLQISAFAEEGATVVTISKGADGAEIVAALNAAFPDETSDTWFYEAEGRVDFLGTSKVAWTNVDGTESIKEGRRTYKFLPLSKQWTYGSGKEDRPVDEYHGIYVNTVKSAEGRKEITLKVVDKSTPTIVLDNPGDVMLVHKRSDDGTYTDIDWDAVNNSILAKVKVNGEDSVNYESLNVEQKYGAFWEPLEGKTLGNITTVKPVSSGSYKVRVAWAGNDEYRSGTSNEVSIKFVDRYASEIALQDAGDGYTVTNVNEVFDVLGPTVTAAGVPEGETFPVLTAANITIHENLQLKYGDTFNVTVSFGGNERWAAAESKTVSIQYKGKQTAPVKIAEGKADIQVENVYKMEDGVPVVDADKTWAKVQEAIRAKDVVVSTEEDFTVQTGEIKLPERPESLTNGDVSVSYEPAAEGYDPAVLTFRVTYVDGRQESGIVLKDAEIPKGGEGSVVGRVFAAVYDTEKSKPSDLKADAVKVEYATFKKGALGIGEQIDGNSWKPLTAESSLSGEKYAIRISWVGSVDYKPAASGTCTITMAKTPTSVVLNEGVQFVYQETPEETEQKVYELVLNREGSVLPEDAEISDFTFEYKADITQTEQFGNLKGLVSSVNDLIKKAGGKIPEIDLEKMSAYVPFEGGNVAISIGDLDLGKLVETLENINKIPVIGDRKEIRDFLDSLKKLTSLDYAPIGAGTHEIRVTYKGTEEYAGSFGETVITITKAPVKVSVASATIRVQDELGSMVTAARTDNGRTVQPEAYTIYAGATSEAKAALYLDIPASVQNDVLYQGAMEALKAAGLDIREGITLEQLLGLDNEKLQTVLDFLKKIISPDGAETAQETLALPDLGSIGSGLENVDWAKAAELLKQLGQYIDTEKILEGLRSAGDYVTITLGTPVHRAGAYGVIAVVSDANYEPDTKLPPVGYLIIRLNEVEVSVQPATISAGHTYARSQEVPGFITAEDGAQLAAVYAGVTGTLTTSVWLDLDGSEHGPKTVGELRAALAENPDQVLDLLGVDSPLLSQLLSKAAGLTDALDSTPVYYGVPNVPGAYTATVFASKDGRCDLHDRTYFYGLGMASGILTVGLEGTVKVAVKPFVTINLEDEVPDMVESLDPESADCVIAYMGVQSDMDPAIYLEVPANLDAAFKDVYGRTLSDKLKDGPTVGALKAYLDDSGKIAQVLEKAGLDVNTDILKLIMDQLAKKLPANIQNLDEVPVYSGNPQGMAGMYAVAAVGLAKNHIPGVGMGTLVIKDNLVKVTYVAGLNGSVKSNGKLGINLPKVVEILPSQGSFSGATAVPDEGYHFVNWTDEDGKEVSAEADFRPETGVSATYTAKFAAHDWDEGKVTKEPTCTEKGETTYTCACGATKTEEIDMIPHTEVIDEAVEATCSKTGLTEGSHCSECGKVLVKQEKIPATGKHTWNEGEVTK